MSERASLSHFHHFPQCYSSAVRCFKYERTRQPEPLPLQPPALASFPPPRPLRVRHVAGRAPGAARGELWQEVFGAKGLTCRRRVREPARRAEAARARPQLLVARPARGAFAALAKKRAVLTRVARTVGAAAPEAAERARSGSAAHACRACVHPVPRLGWLTQDMEGDNERARNGSPSGYMQITKKGSHTAKQKLPVPSTLAVNAAQDANVAYRCKAR
jgi:hypothetical protein